MKANRCLDCGCQSATILCFDCQIARRDRARKILDPIPNLVPDPRESARDALARLGARVAKEYAANPYCDLFASDVRDLAIEAGVFRNEYDAEVTQERYAYGVDTLVRELTEEE